MKQGIWRIQVKIDEKERKKKKLMVKELVFLAHMTNITLLFIDLYIVFHM